MIESVIYIPVMIIHHKGLPSIFHKFAKAIEVVDEPGVVVKKVYDASVDLMEYIFTQVEKSNDDGKGVESNNREKYTILKVLLESEESLLHKELPFIEQAIKSVVIDVDLEYQVGVYYSYLIKDDEFKHSNILKIISDGDEFGFDILENNREDDFSKLDEMAMFLNHFWYLDSISNPFEDAYPDLTAKLLLVLEDRA